MTLIVVLVLRAEMQPDNVIFMDGFTLHESMSALEVG
jgi:hypothetical protein